MSTSGVAEREIKVRGTAVPAAIVEHDADWAGSEAVKTGAVEEEPVNETPTVIEEEIVVAVVGSRGARSRHHQTGDACRHEERLPHGMACHGPLPSLVIFFTSYSAAAR